MSAGQGSQQTCCQVAWRGEWLRTHRCLISAPPQRGAAALQLLCALLQTQGRGRAAGYSQGACRFDCTRAELMDRTGVWRGQHGQPIHPTRAHAAGHAGVLRAAASKQACNARQGPVPRYAGWRRLPARSTHLPARCMPGRPPQQIETAEPPALSIVVEAHKHALRLQEDGARVSAWGQCQAPQRQARRRRRGGLMT